ncbi:MAG TPA: hypothetical protein PK784_08300 [Tenuifilaceae bacterium]|nr:hypothetical protein [Tenuifilaceae bacterium]
MNKNVITLLFVTGLLITSCSKQNKAVDEYCNCMDNNLSDSLNSTSLLSSAHTNCRDSIIKEYDLINDNEFVTSFDSIPKVRNKLNENFLKIYQNVDRILQKYNWDYKDVSSLNWRTYEYRRYLFDGKMFKQEVYGMNWGSTNWNLQNTYTGTYKIEKGENDNIYVVISMQDNENDIYRFRKSKKDGYYLDGRRTLWQEDK